LTAIIWYSIDRTLKVESHEPVDLNGAVKIIDQYLSNYKLKYDSGEDALAASMFGFSRGDNDFIEICINGLNLISVEIELPSVKSNSILNIFKNNYKYIETLDSTYELQKRTHQYFTLSPKELIGQLK